jgi:hypothetical protein
MSYFQFIHAWEAGYSPFGVLRAIGPWGPSLVGKVRFHIPLDLRANPLSSNPILP